MTIEPKNVQTILAVKFKDFELRHRTKALRPLLGQGISASNSATWEHSRALIRPNFVRNLIADMEVYERHIAQLIACIPATGTVDLQDLFRMTMDSATDFLFGESVESLDVFLRRGLCHVSRGLATRMRLGPLMIFHHDRTSTKAARDARAYVGRFVRQEIAYRAANDKGDGANKLNQRYVFLYEPSKTTLDAGMLTDQLLNIMLAGRDTTAGLLSITFFITFPQTLPNRAGKLPHSEKGTILPLGGGANGEAPVLVANGQEVCYSVYSMHWLPEIYGPDADQFRPKRWETLKPGWAYIPFNGGPRIYVGQQFALTEAGYTTVRILQRFEGLDSQDREPFTELLTLTIASKSGTKVALRPAK